MNSFPKSAPTKTTLPAGPPACTMADLRVEELQFLSRSTDTTRVLKLLLVNQTDHFCQIGGWPTATLVDSAQNDVTVPTTWEEPGESGWFELEPGVAAAGTVITWVVCDRDEADCPSGDSIRIGLPSGGSRYLDLTGLTGEAKPNITMASLNIEDLAPAAYGP